MKCHFDHEKLDVYRVVLEFITWTTGLLEELRSPVGVKVGEVFDHLDRASLSVLFNTAEGNGKRRMKTRARFFDDARGSTTECAACLDALVAKGVCSSERVQDGKELLVKSYAMLTRLVSRFSGDNVVREEGEDYRVRIEDECEDEDD